MSYLTRADVEVVTGPIHDLDFDRAMQSAWHAAVDAPHVRHVALVAVRIFFARLAEERRELDALYIDGAGDA